MPNGPSGDIWNTITHRYEQMAQRHNLKTTQHTHDQTLSITGNETHPNPRGHKSAVVLTLRDDILTCKTYTWGPQIETTQHCTLHNHTKFTKMLWHIRNHVLGLKPFTNQQDDQRWARFTQ